MTRTTGQRLRAVTLPYVGLRAAGQAAEFVGWVLLARRLAPAGLGQLAVAFLLFRYVGLVADWGAIGRGARDVAAQGRHGSVRTFVAFRTRLSLSLAAAAALVALATQQAEVAPVAVLVLSLGMNRDWIALGREQGARAGLPLLLQGATIAAGGAFAETTLQGAFVVAAGYAVSVVVSVLLNPLASGDERGSSARPDHWLLVGLLANQATSTFDIVMLGSLVGSAQAGIYSAVYRLPNAFIALLGSVVGAFLPIATATHHEGGDAHRVLVRRSLVVSSVSATLVLASVPLLWALVPLLLGAEYEPGRAPLVVLTVATALITLTAPLHSILLARGRDRSYAAIVVTGTCANVALNLALIPPHQMMGAAWATLLSQVVVAVLLALAVSRTSRTAGTRASGS